MPNAFWQTTLQRVSEFFRFVEPVLPIFFFVAATLAAALAGGRVPLKALFALSLILTLCLTSLAGRDLSIEVFTQHVVVGLALGFMVRLIFAAVEGMAELVGLSMGLSFSSLFDAQIANAGPLVNFYRFLALLLFFSLEGHTLCVAIMAHVLTHLPLAVDSAFHVVKMGGGIFANALLLAVPILVPLLFLHIALGMMGRTTVSLNLFGVGFPLLLASGVILLYVSLPAFAASFESLLSALFSQL